MIENQEPGTTEVIPLKELERRAIDNALRVAGGSVQKAAKLLGIGRATLYRKIAAREVEEQRERLQEGSGG